MAAIREARKNDFLDFFANDPARIHLPQDDLAFFDSLFVALDSAGSHRVRIMHYGDSQIEEDRISNILRDSLQTRFGGGGPGLLPVLDQYYTFSISEGSSAEPRRYLAYGPAEMRGAAGRYGPLAQKSHYDGTVTTTFFPVKENVSPSRYFNRLTLLSAGSDLYVKCNGAIQEPAASDSIRHIVFHLPDSTERVSVTHSGSHDIYGVMLDRETGVCVDNIPMRGCSGLVFTGIKADQLSGFYNTENVRLIILQYGGNSVPFTKTEKQISDFCSDIARQIVYLQEQAPGARILFIGPSDMSTTIQGKMQTYKQLPAIVDSLRVTAVRSGAAYWDMYAAMGGQGSMTQWVRQSPPLANEDYIHFTRRGAAKMGDMLYETLMLYYEYYKLANYE
jgi:lysophospholipase L1-like esterase